jgi:DNA-binding NarL/FixJ family response regulator
MIRVFIIDENYLICNVMSTLLEKEADIEVVGCAATYHEEVVNQAVGCDIVLLDGKLPNQHKFTFMQLLTTLDPLVKVIVIGLHKSEQVILHHLEAGAAGYVLQDESVDKLLKTIRATYQGEAFISPRMTTRLIDRIAELKQLLIKQGVYTNVLPGLTDREREVLELVKQGFSNREIGERLVIEVGTVKNHIHNILRKFNANSRRDVSSILELVEFELVPNVKEADAHYRHGQQFAPPRNRRRNEFNIWK